MSDDFDKKIEWCQRCSGDARAEACTVVAWEAIATTLNELVNHFNDIPARSTVEKQRFREVQLKKLIIGMLYEMDKCLSYWAGVLNKKGSLSDRIKELSENFQTALKKVGRDNLKSIRNRVAFHFTNFDPEATIETYLRVDRLSKDSINEIVKAANDCGFEMQRQTMESMV